MKWGMRLCGSWVPISHLNNPTLTQKLRIFTFSGWSGHIWRHPVPPSEILSTSPTNFILRGLAAGGSGGSEVYLHHHVWRYSQHCGGKKSFVPINKSTKCCFFLGENGGISRFTKPKGFPCFPPYFLHGKTRKSQCSRRHLTLDCLAVEDKPRQRRKKQEKRNSDKCWVFFLCWGRNFFCLSSEGK